MSECPPFVVTADVEGAVERGSFESVDALATVVNDLAVPMTLFVTPAVVEARTETVRDWAASGHTVGLHVHPARLGGDSDWLDEYDQAAIEEFLREGIATFESHLDRRPTAFRAGRWSFSPTLLRVLGTVGIDYDASHRPTALTAPYAAHGVTECPLSVYGVPGARQVFRPWGLETLPMTVDALTASRLRAPLLYLASVRLLAAASEYFMIAFHDYDLLDPSVRRRIERYVARLSEVTRPATLTNAVPRW